MLVVQPPATTMIQDTDVYETQGIAEAAGYLLVRLTRFRHARRMLGFIS